MDPWQEEQDYEINSRHDRWEGWGDPDPSPPGGEPDPGDAIQGPPPPPNEQEYDPPGPNDIPF